MDDCMPKNVRVTIDKSANTNTAEEFAIWCRMLTQRELPVFLLHFFSRSGFTDVQDIVWASGKFRTRCGQLSGRLTSA